MPDALAQFANAKYLNLETYRKNGVGVRTPVWFAEDPATRVFYVYSEADAGKVKRVRNNPKVRIAPCNFRGTLLGAWVDAPARFCDSDEAAHGQDLLRRKYWLKRIGDFFSRLRKSRNVVLAIEMD